MTGRRSAPRPRARALARLLLLVVCLLVPVAHGAPATAAPDGPAPEGGPGARPDPVGAWPLSPVPEVVTGFDPPATAYGAGHRGVDLAGREGQPVRAALAGRIVFTGMVAGRPVVAVDHGGTRTTYEPVASTVPRGRWVGRGDRIGRLGLVGSHCFPRSCLHWGWRRGEEYLDPLRLVGAGPVRLLPLTAPIGGPSGSPAAGRIADAGTDGTGAPAGAPVTGSGPPPPFGPRPV